MARARYIMIGGFLGAGKTTAILRLAQRLVAGGQRVGLITNDQGQGLVDTARARVGGLPVEEISGGCFCCRFNSLVEAARRLAEQSQPDVFIAEPVGSCTDLVATVSFPLRRMYGANYQISPLSVMIDPIRASRILGLDTGKKFSGKVLYIYLKQLEEADIIVINKCDLIDASQRKALCGALAERFPRAEIFECSARDGSGLEAWFDRITTAEQDERAIMDVDYATYGEGEALLGWLNAALTVEEAEPFDGNIWLLRFAGRLQERLDAEGVEVAHLKMTLMPTGDAFDIGAVHLVRNDQRAELSHTLLDPVASGDVILNLRAEALPELLESITRLAINELAGVKISNLASFQPGQPNPTHRMCAAESKS